MYALLDYVKELLDGLQTPAGVTCNAYVAPPLDGEAQVGVPQLFVWEKNGPKERRQTMTRMTGGVAGTGGMKKLAHTVHVYVIVLDEPGEASAKAFFQTLNAIAAKLRAVSLPFQLSDPDTNVATTIVDFGEELDTTTDVVRRVGATAGIVRYLACVTTGATEVLQS